MSIILTLNGLVVDWLIDSLGQSRRGLVTIRGVCMELRLATRVAPLIRE